ncbi:TIGR04086 family membrane protein [Bacillaceae bacterium Marseille-Q3522]|nr:TIGR04086 family membrane protein [Bacillaceae bacterium Marseille-Q3522]
MEGSKHLSSAILFGVVSVFLIAIVSSFIFSILLRFTELTEGSLQFTITAVSFITLFVGGFISGGKGRQKGWFLGGLTGLIYSLIVFIFQYLGFDRLFSFEQIVYHVCYTFIAMMGGILGVNVANSKMG